MKTVQQLMDEALGLAELDSNAYLLARNWLNTVLDKLSRDFDWPFYAKTYTDQAFVAGTTEYSLPSDFQRPNQNPYLIQNGQRGSAVRVVEPAIFEMERSNSTSGAPSVCFIKTTYTAGAPVLTVVFDSSPGTGSNAYWRLPYFRQPTVIDTAGADDAKIPDFLNQDVLIEELVRLAMKYQDDERYPMQKGDSEDSQRKAKFNVMNQTSPKIQLSTDCFRVGRSGRRRFGSGGGWMGP